MPVPLPEKFGRYRILTKLGEGGMGAVYLAEDTALRRRVALKVPKIEGKQLQAVLHRFYREARVASEIHHAGVCPVYDVGCIDDIHYLTMAYIEGRTLDDLLAAGGPWPAPAVVDLIVRIADALRALHAKDIVHRDLKPDNIMIKPDGASVLLDFGLARSLQATSQMLTGDGVRLGTPGYMAPEQVGGTAEDVGTWTDVYALGVILFELLTGRRPFEGTAMEVFGRVACAPRPLPSAFRPYLPADLDAFCAAALAIDARQRPQDMLQFSDRLRQIRLDPGAGADMPARPAGGASTVSMAEGVWMGDTFRTANLARQCEVLPETLTNSLGMEFVLIPAGRFLMGSPATEAERSGDEGPQHEVEIPEPFYLGRFTVTQEQYAQVMGTNPANFCHGGQLAGRVPGLATGRFPVENVSWTEAVEFCLLLSCLQTERETQCAYRLPTEAEWEYACRAGANEYQAFHHGARLTFAEANFDSNHPYGATDKRKYVGRPVACDDPGYRPNAFGLHHMHGNVWEWCQDRYADNYYQTCLDNGLLRSPQGPADFEATARVVRGGSWLNMGRECRSAYRNWLAPDDRFYYVGFRVVCVVGTAVTLTKVGPGEERPPA